MASPDQPVAIVLARSAAKRLRSARKARKLTQVQAAAAWAAVTGHPSPGQAFVAKIERGLRRVRSTELDVFARIYRVPTRWLLEPALGDEVPGPVEPLPLTFPPKRQRPRGRLGLLAPTRGVHRALPLTDPERRAALTHAILHEDGVGRLSWRDVTLWTDTTAARESGGPYFISEWRATDVDLLEMVNADGETPLYEALRLRRYHAARLLLGLGASMTTRQLFTVADPRRRGRMGTRVPVTPWEQLVEDLQPVRGASLDHTAAWLLVESVDALDTAWRAPRARPVDLYILRARRAIRGVVRTAHATGYSGELEAAAISARRTLEDLQDAVRASTRSRDRTLAVIR